MVIDPKIVQYVEELDLLIIRDGAKLYHITGDVIAGMWKAYAEGHGIDYDICEGCECVDPETVVPLEDYRSMEQTVHKLTQAIAEVEPKHGRWRHYEGMLTCSVCHTEIYDDIMELLGDDVPRYCPNCGTDMREVEE